MEFGQQDVLLDYSLMRELTHLPKHLDEAMGSRPLHSQGPMRQRAPRAHAAVVFTRNFDEHFA